MRTRPDDPLARSLAGLEGAGASEGFTERVLEGLAVQRIRRRRQRRLAMTSAAVALAAAVITLQSVLAPQPSTRTELAEEASRLQREYDQLQSELEDLRSSARETAPVLYLGGDDEMDLVIDLGPIVTRSAPVSLPSSVNGINPYEL